MTTMNLEGSAPTAPTLARRLEQLVAGTLGRTRRRTPATAVEDLWDPAGVPSPLDIVMESRVQRVAWWLWTSSRR